MKKLVAGVGAALAVGVTVLGLVMAPQAMAADETGPDSVACTNAKAALELKLAAVLDLGKDKFPGDTLPAVEAINVGLLNAVLKDSDLGEGGQVVVKVAIAAFEEKDKKCAVPPTTTVTVTPSPTAVPPVYADCAAVRAAGKAPLALDQPGYRAALDSDSDGLACEDVEGTVPVPSQIDTGRP